MSKINAAVIGAAGYTGGELTRLLVNHPEVNLVSAVSQSQQGKLLSDSFTDLTGETDLKFSAKADKNADVYFLCLQHGDSENYLKENPYLLKSRIIDLSRDYRLNERNTINGETFVYGLPELNKEKIKKAKHIANPGCFATAIQLGLLPLASKQLLKSTINVTAITGSTGAGIKLSNTTHFSWRQNNVSAYQPFEHAHNAEIEQSLRQLQNNFSNDFLFIPQRGSFTRGIMATILLECSKDENELKSLYQDFYKNEFFTGLVEQNIDLKMVVNTNKCFINIKKHKGHLLVVSIIDNLLKGAAGQAVQNMKQQD